MKKNAKVVVLCIALATIFSAAVYLRVSAGNTPATAKQMQQISSNCISLKNTINQLHASDALLRVNMGQRYELMATKLMDKFNNRVATNGFDVGSLVSASTDYKVTLDSFRVSYKDYEEHIVAVLKIDCQSQPSAFYDALLLARVDRSKVYENVASINSQIDRYKSALEKFEADYRSGGSK